MKRFFLALLVLAGVFVGASPGDEKSDRNKPAKESPLRTELLQGKDASDFFGTLGRTHELSRVVVRLKKWRSDAEGYEDFETTVEVEKQDAKVLKAVTAGVVESKWGRRMPDSVGAIGAYPIGEVVLESERGKCRILLQSRFHLDRDGSCDSTNAFESWTLAKVVDELLKEKQGKGLPEKDFKLFSGEHSLESQQKRFRELWGDSSD